MQTPREAYPADKLLDAAEMLRPNLVVAPDWELNDNRTAERILSFCRVYQPRLKRMKVGILGMLHGISLKRTLENFTKVRKSIVAVGLSRSLETSIGRPNLAAALPKSLPIHIFGIHGDPSKEVDRLLKIEDAGRNIIGISTDLPVRLGFQCRLLDEYRPEPPQLDWESPHDPYPKFTLDNVEELILQARGEA